MTIDYEELWIYLKTLEYSRMHKRKLARLAATSGESTFTYFFRVYSKHMLVDFMVFEYEDYQTLFPAEGPE